MKLFTLSALNILILACFISMLAAVPFGIWHTATFNSPAIVLGFVAVFVFGTLVQALMAVHDMIDSI